MWYSFNLFGILNFLLFIFYFSNLEFVEGGSLFDLIFSESKITNQMAIRFSKEICCGLLHLHNNNIIHRDLATRNVLLRKGTMQCVVTDFGYSRVIESEEGLN